MNFIKYLAFSQKLHERTLYDPSDYILSGCFLWIFHKKKSDLCILTCHCPVTTTDLVECRKMGECIVLSKFSLGILSVFHHKRAFHCCQIAVHIHLINLRSI